MKRAPYLNGNSIRSCKFTPLSTFQQNSIGYELFYQHEKTNICNSDGGEKLVAGTACYVQMTDFLFPIKITNDITCMFIKGINIMAYITHST